MKKYRNLLLIVLAFLAGTIATTAVIAHGGDINLIHACVKNSNGSIRIVGANDDCSPNTESPLDWNIQGPPGNDGSAGSSLTVVDSQNQEVGSFLSENTVAFNTGNHWVSVGITPIEFIISGSINLYYVSSDCTGDPYTPIRSMTRPGTIIGNTIYYGGDPIIRNQTTSNRLFIGPDTYEECFQRTDTALMGPLQTYQLPSFTPPFSIRTNE